MMSRLYLIFLILFLPVQAFALSSDWTRDDAVGVRLVSGVEGVDDNTTIPLGLDVQLNDGWHTYWRSPGEAGLPPQLDWSRSQTDSGNLESATLLYPAPRRYTAYGLETIGYENHVLFPIDAVLRNKGQALNADVDVDLLVCSATCVPKHYSLTLTVPKGPTTASPEANLLRQAHEQIPTDADSAGILLQGIANDGQNLTFTILSRDSLSQPDIFIEDDKNIGFGAPVVKIDTQSHSATLTVKTVDTLPADEHLAHMPVTLTIINNDHAAEIKITTPTAFSAPPPPAPKQLPFDIALLFALIGGFILNLMPCVLPVLSLKILSVVSHGGGDSKRVRHSFLFTATGIIFSFLVMAFVTIILKQFGLALGWGVQFQQPVFLMFLILLLTFFAANMWGVFEIPLPRALADNLDTSYHPKLAGDFATGAFATLLATPCSAPFLGTAVGFALGSGIRDIISIFAALGLGMALPYLSIALFPRVATMLPKPGAWMLHLRRILGIALAATAAWLVWVLAAQITAMYAVVFGLFMTAIILLLILKNHGIKKGLITFGILEFCLVALVLGFSGALKPKTDPVMARQWLAFDQNALNADIAEGKTVFLDVTADWCLTCKANMKFSLSDEAVTQRLFQTDVIAMQADWTNPDPVITDLLHKYGRYGIPFNIVYGPRAPQGIVLPELLTPSVVLKALDDASPTPP
jgi:suppressor for copper-sensitivity B